MTLTISGVANIFLRMRHHQERVKAHHIESSSGSPQSHPTIAENASGKTGPFELTETFVCSDAVNMNTLLGATRDSLVRYAMTLGSNTLVDEQYVFSNARD